MSRQRLTILTFLSCARRTRRGRVGRPGDQPRPPRGERDDLGREPRRAHDPRVRRGHGGRRATVDDAGRLQPGDLAYAKGKLYVAEEFGSPPASRSSTPRPARC